MTTTLPQGVYRNLPAEAYHKATGVSQTALKHLDPPARYPVYKSTPVDVTPWMRLGTLIHAAVLEPHKPLPKIAVQPETYPGDKGEAKPWHNGSNYCKAWRKERVDAGIEVLTKTEWENLNGCVRSISAHPTANEAFSDGESEVSIFRLVELPSGRSVWTKCRLDFVTSGDAIVDLKKVQRGKAQAESFEWLVWDRDLHVQAAFYLDAWNAMNPGDQRSEWCWVAVEEDAPHLVAVHRAAPELILQGRATYIDRLERFAECSERDHWPGYPEQVGTVGIPAAIKRRGL